MNERILIAEDDPASGKLIKEYLKSKGFLPDLAVNGKDAVDYYNTRPYPIVLTDLEMPVMSGEELIKELSNVEEPPLFFVLTAHQNPETIIELMKTGVYDYLVKPVNLTDLHFKIIKALDHIKIVRANKIFNRERVARLENQLDWYKWQERALNTNDKTADNAMFQGMLLSFNQGAGFGAIVTLLNIIAQNAVKEGDFYKIETELFDTVIRNNDIAEKALDTFSAISGIIQRGLTLKPVTVNEIHELIKSVIEKTKKYAVLKNQKIVLSESKPLFNSIKINMEMDQFRKVVNELFLNAYKYSKIESSILVIMDIENDKLRVSIANSPGKDEKNRFGIPVEFENIIFEPFFRLRKTVQEEYNTLDFGLGLTLVEKIVLAHGGTIGVSTVTDFTDLKKEPDDKVNFVINLPVV